MRVRPAIKRMWKTITTQTHTQTSMCSQTVKIGIYAQINTFFFNSILICFFFFFLSICKNVFACGMWGIRSMNATFNRLQCWHTISWMLTIRNMRVNWLEYCLLHTLSVYLIYCTSLTYYMQIGCKITVLLYDRFVA